MSRKLNIFMQFYSSYEGNTLCVYLCVLEHKVILLFWNLKLTFKHLVKQQTKKGFIQEWNPIPYPFAMLHRI